jgi:hypothetical protein
MGLENRVDKLERAFNSGGDGEACVCRNPTVVRYDRGDSFAAAAEDRDSDTRAAAVCANCGGEKVIIRVVRVPRKFTTSEWKSYEPTN